MSKEMVIEVWSKEGDVIENLPKVTYEAILKHGLILCTDVINFVRIASFHLQEEKNEVRRPEDIIQEVRQLAAHGYQEITSSWSKCKCIWKGF